MSKITCFFVLMSRSFAQDSAPGRLQFDWDKLAAKASEKADVTLEGPLLEMASKFLSDKKGGDEAKIQQLVQGLKGVYVKHFEFDKEGQYSEADLAAIRSQLKSPDWSKIVDVQEKHESSSVYLRMAGGQPQGIVVLAAEPKELTVVQIIGPIDLDQLSKLGGKMGIPRMEMGPKSKTAAPKKDDE
jgi:hypothetical protein